jgi:coenzyme F420-reducing hydrogenase gamma subunit
MWLPERPNLGRAGIGTCRMPCQSDANRGRTTRIRALHYMNKCGRCFVRSVEAWKAALAASWRREGG